MSFFQNLRDNASAQKARVVFPEWEDPRIAEAVARLKTEGLCRPVPLAEISQAQIDALVAARGMKETIAKRFLTKPLFRAAAMVAAGEADVLVAGAIAPSKKVIEAAHLAIGLAGGVKTASSFFLMDFPDGRQLLFADCAVNVAPDAEQLADIARASKTSADALFGEGRVALLSFSTGTSGAGKSVEMVRQVAEATGFDGPVQADAALNPATALRKGIGSGEANVLVFPNLDAGNIGYKLCQELAGAQAYGPILQGFRKPVCDLSRGATADDIVTATLITLALAG